MVLLGNWSWINIQKKPQQGKVFPDFPFRCLLVLTARSCHLRLTTRYLKTGLKTSGTTPKWWFPEIGGGYPQIIHFNRIFFHNKLTILDTPMTMEPPQWGHCQKTSTRQSFWFWRWPPWRRDASDAEAPYIFFSSAWAFGCTPRSTGPLTGQVSWPEKTLWKSSGISKKSLAMAVALHIGL